MEFVEAPFFTLLLKDYLSDDEYRALQLHLARDPEAGDVIPGTGGFRKLRWADRRRGKGKRGGLRMIYYYLAEDSQIWFLAMYDKDEAADLSPTESASSRRRSRKKLNSASIAGDPGGSNQWQKAESE